MPEPVDILDAALRSALASLDQTLVKDANIRQRVEYVSCNLKNRAGVRLLMACLLAKIHRPNVDIRKPYTEIGDNDAYSGRMYDERYISAFISKYDLPCNSTTAFLTPALRNRNTTLTPDIDLVGRPAELYRAVLQLLDDVYRGRVSASVLLAETVRWLLVLKNKRQLRIQSLLEGLQTAKGALPLSSEEIINLIGQHMSLPGTSRLPVLMVAAAYQTVEDRLGERILALHAHNAADKQTGALGDLEITLIDDNQVVTSYEMKDRKVTVQDVDRALQKLLETNKAVDNYIFITTADVDEEVQKYAQALYDETGGIEFVILDCMSFVRHFLHLFHRVRGEFLEVYQSLMLQEPESAVSQPVKEAFLAIRQATEARAASSL